MPSRMIQPARATARSGEPVLPAGTAAPAATMPPPAGALSSAPFRQWSAVALARAAWPYLVATILCWLLRAPTLTDGILQTDEASYFAQAARLRSLPAFVFAFYYRTETKTQIGLLPYLLANRLNHQHAELLLHLMGLTALWISAWLLISFSRRFLGSPIPGLASSLATALFLEVGPGYTWGWNNIQFFPPVRLEYFQLPFVLGSLYAFCWGIGTTGQRPRRAGWLLFAAGLAWGVAVLIKLPALLLGPLYLALQSYLGPPTPLRGGRLRQWVRDASIFGLGPLLLAGAVLGPYLFYPAALAELRFNLIVVNGTYAAVGNPWGRLILLILATPPLLLALYLLALPFARHTFLQRDAPAQSRVLGLIVLAGAAVFIGCLPGQGLFHYVIPVLPLLALAVAGYARMVLTAFARRGHPRLAIVLAGVLALAYVAPQLPLLAAFPGAVGADFYLNNDRRRFDLDGLVRYIQAHTRPEASIWVYYHAPEIYQLSDRAPATRDPSGEWLSFAWSEPWFTRTADDLQAERPDLIIGIAAPWYAVPHALPLMQIPRVSGIIARDYHCDAAKIRGVVLCSRSGGTAGAPAPRPTGYRGAG